jgi:hypothetical protein
MMPGGTAMRLVFTLLAVSLAVATACKKSGDTSKGSGEAVSSNTGAGSSMAGSSAAAGAPAKGSSAGSGSSMAGGGSADTSGTAAASAGAAAPAIADGPGSGAGGAAEAMPHRAGMCPSTVLGATTRAAAKGKTVIVTVESDDKDAIAAIQKRADELLEKRAAPTGVGHDRKGTHGGARGLCPVYVPEGAKAAARRAPRGVVVTITPKDKPDELATEIDARIAKAAAWIKANVKDGDKQNQGGVGGGKGEDGSNHSGKGDGKGHERRKGGGGTGGGGGAGTGGGSGKRI